MGENTGISWATATWNPWQGCHKVSEACAHCYMYRQKKQYGQDATTVIRSSKATFNLPLTSHTKGFESGGRVFVCSWSDFCIEEADAWRAEAWSIIRERKDLTFLILTKRVDRLPECLPPDWGDGYPNVWLGVTAENQQRWDERVPRLLKVPAKVHFVSCGPLLGSIDPGGLAYVSITKTVRGDYPIGHHIAAEPGVYPARINQYGAVSAVLPNGQELGIKPSEYEWAGKLDLVITEGESGPDARITLRWWVKLMRDRCVKAGVKFHHKQWGEWAPFWEVQHSEVWKGKRNTYAYNPDGTSESYYLVGVKAAGRLLDGQLWDQLPTTP